MSLVNVQISDLILFLLACGGLTDIITRDSMFRWLREWETSRFGTSFFTCHRCFGFWAGVIMLLLFTFGMDFIAYPFAASYVCVTIFNWKKLNI